MGKITGVWLIKYRTEDRGDKPPPQKSAHFVSSLGGRHGGRGKCLIWWLAHGPWAGQWLSSFSTSPRLFFFFLKLIESRVISKHTKLRLDICFTYSRCCQLYKMSRMLSSQNWILSGAGVKYCGVFCLFGFFSTPLSLILSSNGTSSWQGTDRACAVRTKSRASMER